MKKILLILFLCVWSFPIKAQTAVPKGKAQLIEFTNATAKFTVPEGKTWIIYSIFSDYITGGTVDNRGYLIDSEDVRIFIKKLNGVQKTNFVRNIYGPQLYRTGGAEISYPIVFPEKTTFDLITLKGSAGSLKKYSGKSYLSLVESDN
jgi:hypothetical protein|tara:strand:- start:172 stop:615 length:444 start_codon:yes stop_codon:yes gene_type:complete